MTDVTYQKFVRQWRETTELPPQTVGPLTPLYKRVTKRLKVMPFPLLIMASMIVVVGLCLLLGSAMPFLVSVLQRGF